MTTLRSLRRAASELAATTMRAVNGKYRAHGDAAGADCVVAFAFGFRRDSSGVTPGAANSCLADEILLHFQDKPVIAQFEIDDALRLEHDQAAAARIESADGEYLDTRGVAAQAVAIMRSKGWQTAVVVAHPFHMPRADAVVRALGIDTAVPSGIKPVWDHRSAQGWTRSKSAWARREPLTIAYYAAKGWM